MAKWKCKECGYIYEGDELPADFVCPVCGKGADQFELITEDESVESVTSKMTDAKPANKYAGTETEKNLMAAFAGELVKKAISKLLPFLTKRQTTSAIMPRCGSES